VLLVEIIRIVGILLEIEYLINFGVFFVFRGFFGICLFVLGVFGILGGCWEFAGDFVCEFGDC